VKEERTGGGGTYFYGNGKGEGGIPPEVKVSE